MAEEIKYFLIADYAIFIFYLPNVSGGGLTQGTTKDYEIDLVAGEYIFSCPLNPTPDYPIVVN